MFKLWNKSPDRLITMRTPRHRRTRNKVTTQWKRGTEVEVGRHDRESEDDERSGDKTVDRDEVRAGGEIKMEELGLHQTQQPRDWRAYEQASDVVNPTLSIPAAMGDPSYRLWRTNPPLLHKDSGKHGDE